MPSSIAAQKRAKPADAGQTPQAGEGGTPATGEEPKKARDGAVHACLIPNQHLAVFMFHAAAAYIVTASA